MELTPGAAGQVEKAQAAVLKEMEAATKEHMQSGQRELSRGVLAPTVQVVPSSRFPYSWGFKGPCSNQCSTLSLLQPHLVPYAVQWSGATFGQLARACLPHVNRCQVSSSSLLGKQARMARPNVLHFWQHNPQEPPFEEALSLSHHRLQLAMLAR